MVAIKVMKSMKAAPARNVMKAKRVLEGKSLKVNPAGNKFAMKIADSKRKANNVKAATEPNNRVAKNGKLASAKDQKAERKATVCAMELADLEQLHKTYLLGTKPVKEFQSNCKDELNALQLPDLKKRCTKKDLKVGGPKGELVQRLLDHASEGLKASMVQAVLEFEAAREAKVQAVVSQLKKEVASKSNDELKQLLTGYGLKVGGSKDERIARIVERQRADGKVETVLASMVREDRKKTLLAMDTTALMAICEKTKEVLDDRLVKEILVDRLVASEAKGAGAN